MITAQAIVSPTSVLYWVFITLSASGSVFISCFVQATSGHRKLFHAPTKVKIASASSDDRTTGSTTRTNVLKFPHPSIFAASMRSEGTSRMACLIIKTPNAVGSGRIRARYIFSHPRPFVIRNNGNNHRSHNKKDLNPSNGHYITIRFYLFYSCSFLHINLYAKESPLMQAFPAFYLCSYSLSAQYSSNKFYLQMDIFYKQPLLLVFSISTDCRHKGINLSRICSFRYVTPRCQRKSFCRFSAGRYALCHLPPDVFFGPIKAGLATGSAIAIPRPYCDARSIQLFWLSVTIRIRL